MVANLRRSQVFGEATRLLLAGGFSEAGETGGSVGLEIRVFEDRRTIVGVCFFEHWTELAEQWATAQGALVDRISSDVRRSDAKSWEGYLLLLTTEEGVPAESVSQIRRNTSRLRKLVATGAELRSLESVAETLLPVLPLEIDEVGTTSETLLQRLPEMLAASGVDLELARAAIRAFEDDRTLMEGIWDWRRSQ